MNESDIKKGIKKSISNCTPDNLDKILLECESIKRKEIFMKKSKENKLGGWIKNLSFVACGVVLAVVATLSVNKISANKVDSVISLDVNPSVEIEVNKNERVLSAISLNDEGKTVLEDMDLKGTDLDVAVNAIIGSMVKNGFIDELANSILVSVTSDNSAKGEELKAKLSEEIDLILKNANIEGSVLSQTVSEEDALEKLATEYGVTIGKVKLINEIIENNNTLKFENLVKLSINELNLIKESKQVETTNVTTTGNASAKAYIGNDKAKEVALNHAGVKEADIYDLDIDFDSENGILVYEVEFKTKNFEFEYDINAKTGEVVKNEKENNDDYAEDVEEGKVNNSSTGSGSSSSSGSSSTSKNYISKINARSIALDRAGVSQSQIRDYEIELDNADDPGEVDKYEISFKVDNMEYDVEINAITGKVIEFKKEIDD